MQLDISGIATPSGMTPIPKVQYAARDPIALLTVHMT